LYIAPVAMPVPLRLLLLMVAAAAGDATGPAWLARVREVRRQAWRDGASSISALMERGEPTVLTGSPLTAWAPRHFSPAQLERQLDMLFNVRRSAGSASFTYYSGKEWAAIFGSKAERAAVRARGQALFGGMGAPPDEGRGDETASPFVQPAGAEPHQVLGLLPAGEFFAHVNGPNASAPPFYYAAGALDEKVVVKEGAPPLLPELEALLPLLAPLPRHDWRPHLWLGQPGVSVTLHYDTEDNTYLQLHGRKRFVLVPPNASGAVYLHPVHHPHNGQARAHFDLDWAAGSAASAKFPAFEGVWAAALRTDLGPGEVLVLPANWLHHVSALPPSLSVSANLWTRCPAATPRGGCNFAMGHVPYDDDRAAPRPARRARLQAHVTAVARSLLAEFTPLTAGEAVSVLYPGPGRHRYPATVRRRLRPGAWQIDWDDGDPEHTEAPEAHIYRRGAGVFSAAEPERAFFLALLEQRYAGLLRPGHPADAPPPEGALHPAAPELAAVAWREGFEAQLDRTLAAFRREHGASTIGLYLGDWVDRLLGQALGLEEVPAMLLAMACPPEPCGRRWRERRDAGG
jgi:hypothetical protein